MQPVLLALFSTPSHKLNAQYSTAILHSDRLVQLGKFIKLPSYLYKEHLSVLMLQAAYDNTALILTLTVFYISSTSRFLISWGLLSPIIQMLVLNKRFRFQF